MVGQSGYLKRHQQADAVTHSQNAEEGTDAVLQEGSPPQYQGKDVASRSHCQADAVMGQA